MDDKEKGLDKMIENIQENIRNGIIDERDVNFFLLGSEAGIQISLLTLAELMLKTSATDASYNYIRKNVLQEVGDVILEASKQSLEALRSIVAEVLPEEELEEDAEEENK